MKVLGCQIGADLTRYNKSGGKNSMWNLKLFNRAILQIDVIH